MAKTDANPAVAKVAEQLFVANWRPGSGLNAWRLAADAYAAAGEFLRVSELIAQGATPAEIPEYIAAGESK